jgi:hypothetical protein
MLQTRSETVPDGILLAPCPPGVTGEYRVIWRGRVIYEKTPEEWKFPEPAAIVGMIDAAD